jgi:hypothetical protein
MHLCLLQYPWKYELIWASRSKIIVKIQGVTRWREKDKKLRVTWLFFISLRMYIVFKETFYARFVANSVRYPIEKKILRIDLLFWIEIGLINVTRWRSRNAMMMNFVIIFSVLHFVIFTSPRRQDTIFNLTLRACICKMLCLLILLMQKES